MARFARLSAYPYHGVMAAVALTNRQYWRSPNPSATFHGRDIFAPVATPLAAGVTFADLGCR